MKVGDLVKLNDVDYPQFRDKVALIVEVRLSDRFVVSVGDKIHPYFVHKNSIEVLNESR
jgi:hypothetical protein